MEVFISWSGECSKYVAKCLHVWLKQVIQMVKPWMSSEDILAGARWNAEIAKHLSETKFGVICVTPENLNAPWLVFESGAIAKTIDDKTHVCQYLIGLHEIDPLHPLSQFQCKPTTKEGTYDVVRSMHSALLAASKDVDLSEGQVKEAFDQWWPKLSEQLQKIPVVPVELVEENKPDQMAELLALTKGVAQSVSALQAQVASPFATAPVYGVGSPIYTPGLFARGIGGGFYSSGALVLDTIDHLRQAPSAEGTPVGQTNDVLSRIRSAPMPPEPKLIEEIAIVCPECNKSNAIEIKGLAQKIDDDKARHLTASCRNCDNREFGAHVSRTDKVISLCPEDCPYHPQGS
ncbi:MAG: toll/interleukin-1 receptor domain-containing protein [Candidatus Binataceae bacterium]